MPGLECTPGDCEIATSYFKIGGKLVAMTLFSVTNNYLMLFTSDAAWGTNMVISKADMALTGGAAGSIAAAMSATAVLGGFGQKAYLSLLNQTAEEHHPRIESLAKLINASNIPIVLPSFIFYSSPLTGIFFSVATARQLYTGKIHAAARILRDTPADGNHDPVKLALSKAIEPDKEEETHAFAAVAFYLTFLTLNVAVSEGMYAVLDQAPEGRYDGDEQTTQLLSSAIGATTAMIITPALALAAKPVANAVVSCTRSAWTAARDMTTRCLDSAMISSRRYTQQADDIEAGAELTVQGPQIN